MCHLIFLSTGSHGAEKRNNPLEKETGALHGPEPSMFVFTVARFERVPDQQAEVLPLCLLLSFLVMLSCLQLASLKLTRGTCVNKRPEFGFFFSSNRAHLWLR